MDDLIKAHSNGQWELLEKAKFISPEQQKQNKSKATRNANSDAMEAAEIEPKQPAPKPAAVDTPKKKSHLTVIKAEANGQWKLEKDNSVKPFGTSVYNSTANIERKANRTGEVREGVGRNNAVHNYTTSGSSMTAAHEKSQAKEQKKKSKASLKVYSPEEIKAMNEKLHSKT